MKMMKFFLLAAAAVAAISCAKELSPIENETPAPEVELVPMTFTASHDAGDDAETKVAYEGGATVWKVGDKIMVIASTTGTAREFEATSVSEDGKTATFDGLTEAGEETFYAVYPASAYKGEPTDVTTGEKIYVNIPATQQAVAGTFDPNAIFCTASNNGGTFSFKQACAFLKFQINNPEGLKSVRLTVNDSDNIAGLGYLGINEVNAPEHRYTTSDKKLTKFDMITLTAPEGGFESETDYFIAMRANSCPYGLAMYFEYENEWKSISTDKRIFPAKDENNPDAIYGSKGKIRNLGAVDAKATALTPYQTYNVGFDLTVAGKTINKATYGDATLVTKTQGLDKSGVYFVNSDATANFNSGITGNLIVIGNTPGVRSNVSRTGISYLTASDSDDALIMQNVKYVECTANVFQLNAAKPFETIIFDNCLLNVATGKYFILSNSAANTITDFTMSNCDVKMDGNVSLVKMGGSTINSITFENNVLYADAEMTSFLAVNSTAKVESVVFNNNTLYNTTIGISTSEMNEDAILKANNITNFVAKNNYVVYANSNANRYIGRATFVGGNVDNNFYVRKANTTTPIYGVPGTKPAWVINQPAVKGAPANLTTNWDPENGKYILGGYNGVGATR